MLPGFWVTLWVWHQWAICCLLRFPFVWWTVKILQLYRKTKSFPKFSLKDKQGIHASRAEDWKSVLRPLTLLLMQKHDPYWDPQCLCRCRAFGPVPVCDVGSLRAVNLHWKGSACVFWTLTADHSLRPHGIIQSYWFRLSAIKQDWPLQWNLILKQHNVASCFFLNRVLILLDLAALGLIMLSGLCNLSKAFRGLLAQRSTMVGFMVV